MQLPCIFPGRPSENSRPHSFRRIVLHVEAFKPPCHPSFSERCHFLSILPPISPGCPTNVDNIEASSDGSMFLDERGYLPQVRGLWQSLGKPQRKYAIPSGSPLERTLPRP